MNNESMVLCFIDQSGKCNYHLGAAYMVANLISNGYNSRLYTNYKNISIDKIVHQIMKNKPKCVGFTLYDTNYFLVKEISKKIKELNKDIFIFFGGMVATFCYEKILIDFPLCDGCVLFEGEVTSIEIMKYIEGKLPKSEIKNFVYMNELNIININSSRQVCKNLDDYPSPYLTGVIDVVDYYQNHKNSWHRMVQIISSRGCTFSCKYCSNAVLGHNIIREHSIDRVIAEMKYIKKKFIESKIKPRIQFMDDLFTYKKERVLEFCQRLIDEKIDLEFAIQTRPDCIDKEQIEMLAKAGCCAINLGLENVNQEVLSSMGKCANNGSRQKEGEYVRKTVQVVKWANENKIYTSVNLISGWENQKYDNYMEDIDFLENINADYYNIASLIYYPGTYIYKGALKKVKDKVHYIEQNLGLVFSFTDKYFPELYPAEHDTIFNIKKNSLNYFSLRRKDIIRAVMGICNDFELQIITYEYKYPDYNWLKNNVNPTTKIVYLKNSNYNDLYFSNYSFAYDMMLLKYVHEYNLLGENNKKQKMPINNDNELKLDNVIDSIESSKTFFSKLNKMTNNDIIQKFSVNKDNMKILDYCRWCSTNGECPAKNNSRLTIKSDGIYTCHNGIKISDLQDKMDWKSLNQKLLNIMKEVEEERVCSNCEVNNSCSKCIALGNITSKDYCKIKKELLKSKNNLIYDIKKVENYSE